jgi:glycine betaine transporter
VILVAGPFMLVLIAMCVSTLKALRAEPYESTLPPRVRRAVLHAQQQDQFKHQSIALATLGCDGLNDGEQTNSGEPKVGTGTDA